jgi:CheY-like chemotaxis protein
VIVVERYPLARTVLADLLVGDGYRVFQSDSAKSAITCIDQNKDVAAVLADWKCLAGNRWCDTRSQPRPILP